MREIPKKSSAQILPITYKLSLLFSSQTVQTVLSLNLTALQFIFMERRWHNSTSSLFSLSLKTGNLLIECIVMHACKDKIWEGNGTTKENDSTQLDSIKLKPNHKLNPVTVHIQTLIFLKCRPETEEKIGMRWDQLKKSFQVPNHCQARPKYSKQASSNSWKKVPSSLCSTGELPKFKNNGRRVPRTQQEYKLLIMSCHAKAKISFLIRSCFHISKEEVDPIPNLNSELVHHILNKCVREVKGTVITWKILCFGRRQYNYKFCSGSVGRQRGNLLLWKKMTRTPKTQTEASNIL